MSNWLAMSCVELLAALNLSPGATFYVPRSSLANYRQVEILAAKARARTCRIRYVILENQ